MFIYEANNSKRFFDILNNNYVSFDGQIPLFLARFLTKNTGFEKLSGSDIVYDFCRFAKERNYKVFFLGGEKESNRMAVDNIKKKYNIEIAGYSPDFENYPFSDNFNKACLNKIKEINPEILFVGFGMPKQEYWVDDNMAVLSEIGVKYVIGSGGTFNFISNRVKRAPVFIQKIGLEGIYRLIKEPQRYDRFINAFKSLKYIRYKPDFKYSQE
jgi:N-acetylglucosaminyldiphosphoundecaprenol N-acetyl-beta-D-mannosaminyltransferase